MAPRLFVTGTDAPRSKLRSVVTDTFAAEARVSCDQLRSPRAARLCDGVIPAHYGARAFATTMNETA